jgi:replicative DNA helicase
LVVREHAAKAKIERIERAKQELSLAQHINYGAIDSAHTEQIIKDNHDYMEAARNPMTFINSDFDSVVPFFRKNLILIGGKTGEGKSTALANIVTSVIGQVNKETGKVRRALVITNEEKTEDVYNRVTCLLSNWAYTNHDKFTPSQKQVLEKGIQALRNSGMLQVIDDNFMGIPGTTTSIEGIRNILESLIRNHEYYDVILIDYYQNVRMSKEDQNLNQYQVQEMFATMLDQYKNRYPAPIVVLAQVKPPDSQDTPFNLRIKGSKSIPDRATLILEMVADRDNYRTEWIVHKSRFTEAIANSRFFTGFEKGKFVPYNNEFLQKVNKWREEKARRAMARNSGLDKVFEKKEGQDAEVQKKASGN